MLCKSLPIKYGHSRRYQITDRTDSRAHEKSMPFQIQHRLDYTASARSDQSRSTFFHSAQLSSIVTSALSALRVSFFTNAYCGVDDVRACARRCSRPGYAYTMHSSSVINEVELAPAAMHGPWRENDQDLAGQSCQSRMPTSMLLSRRNKQNYHHQPSYARLTRLDR